MKTPLIYASNIMLRLRRTLKRVYYILFILQTLAWTSCQRTDGPSIIVIAVDKLSGDLTTCSDESNIEKSGLTMMCKESIRFTHSYTTSTQTAAAMGSILTGLYPIQHKLFRSFDHIQYSPKYKTQSVAKAAKENNYVTSFFSGSPFILKKTGLSYYFDLFDDSIASAPAEYDQDFNQQIHSFFQWVNPFTTKSLFLNRRSFFSVIYVSELNKLTSIEADQSNFEKFDEKLSHFIAELKAKKLWNESYVFLVGLNGANKFNRPNLNTTTNLHSENTNITTLVKIPRQKGDEGINWKNDLRITLADIGFTIECLLNSCQKRDDLFPILNLSNLWKSKDTSRSKKVFDRSILVQASDNFSMTDVSHRFSILDNNYIYIQNLNNKIEIFNTISDKSEQIDLSKHKLDYFESQKYIDFARTHSTAPLTDHTINDSLYKLNYEYWTSNKPKETLLSNSVNQHDPLFYYYLQKMNHKRLQKNIELKIQKIKFELLNKNQCADLIQKTKISKDDLKICTDDLLIQYLLYTHSNELGLNQEKNKFLYSVMKTNYKNNIARQSVNLAYNNSWGIYDITVPLIHPLVFLDPTFFEN